MSVRPPKQFCGTSGFEDYLQRTGEIFLIFAWGEISHYNSG